MRVRASAVNWERTAAKRGAPQLFQCEIIFEQAVIHCLRETRTARAAPL